MAFDLLRRKRERNQEFGAQTSGAQQLGNKMTRDSQERLRSQMEKDERDRRREFQRQSMERAMKAHEDFAKKNRKF